MIQQLFRMIWTERKINSWIVFELVLVFCILWFCVDYISFFVMRYYEPRGYTIENVYTVNLGMKDDATLGNSDNEAQRDSLINTVWTIVERIKQHPDVEAVSLSLAATPYSSSYSNSSFMIDSVEKYAQIKTVTPDFFKVFGIKVLQGNPAEWNNKNNVFISGDKDNRFAKKEAMQVKTFNLTGNDEPVSTPVTGVVAPSKRSEFDPATPCIYMLLAKNEIKLPYIVNESEICVRTKAGADKDFISRFTKDMQEQINIDPYYLSSVTSMRDLRENYLKWNGYDNNFKSIFAISTFLFINIFLAVVGTFWFRIQTRRGEIGLRMALGSTQLNIKALFIIETLILLLLASIIATPVCINIALIDILKDIGVPSINRREYPATFVQHLVNYCITFIIIMLIAIAAVWHPAQKASKIQPAEALREE